MQTTHLGRSLRTLLIGLSLAGCSGSVAREYRPAGVIDSFANDDFAAVLREVVADDGFSVDYAALHINRNGCRDALYRFVGLMSEVSPESHPQWFPTDGDRLAYWINAHNAAVLRGVVDAGLGAEPGSPQVPSTVTEVKTIRLGGRSMTADDLLTGKIRPLARPGTFVTIHQSIRSSPPLRFEPYDGPQVDSQIADQADRCMTRPALVQRTVGGPISGLNQSLIDLWKRVDPGSRGAESGRAAISAARSLAQAAGDPLPDDVVVLSADRALNAVSR